jgi:hypothetical protein
LAWPRSPPRAWWGCPPIPSGTARARPSAPGPVEATGTLIVNPAPLSITANNASKRYGAADPHFSATITGFVSGDSLASLGGALTLTANELSGIGPSGNATVGTYPITPAGLTSTNYDITVTPGTLTVKPAPLTITTVPASKSYGAADPQFSVTGWGFAPNEGPANLVGTPTFSTNESSDLEPSGNAAVGVYQVTPAGLSSTNYTITFVPGTLTVNPALLVIAANPASKVYGSADPTFTWSTAGLATGETIKNNLQGTLSFSTSEQGSNASVGTYQVTPSGVSSPNYLILFLPGTLTVTAAAPIITWPTPAPITYPTALSITQLDASASWTVGGTPTSVTGTFAYGPPAGTVLGPGSRTLLTVFTPADTVDYTTARKSVTLTVDQAPQAPAITSANNATFEVGTAGTFTVTASGFPNSTLSETGVLPGGVTFTDNGNGTATLAGAPATASGGAYSFSITASNGASPNATQSFTLSVDQAPAITSANSATFKAGTTGTFTVTTSGFPKSTLSETGTLPGGVTFTNNGNGTATLAGTPAAASGGAYSFSIAASNGVTPNAAQSFTLTVDQAPAVTSANNATFKVGTAGTFTVTTSGFPKSTLSETGPLPLNVSFTNNGNGTATLAGAPATGTGGTHSITITASNGVSPNATQSFTLTIDQPPKITSTAGTTFTVGKSGSFTITTTPGVPATTTVSESGPLPSGVSFKAGSNGTATLSGTPAAGSGGVYNVTISAGNAPSSATTQPFTLTVDQAPAITSAAKATFTAGSAGSFTVATTGYPAATFSEIGKLPAGVAFVDNHNGTATLSGTPAASTGSTYSYIDIYASNGVLPEAVQFFTLTVGASSSVKAGVHLSNAATNDAAMMAVLADSSDDTTDTGTKKSLSVSDLALLDGV